MIKKSVLLIDIQVFLNVKVILKWLSMFLNPNSIF